MRIEKLKIKNFKCYRDTVEVSFKEGINIIVGNNEAGKSTILEAINLALTGILNGRYLRNELSPYLFNFRVEKDYIESLKTSSPMSPPEILIEIYFNGSGPEYCSLKGNGNSDHKKESGVLFKIEFDDVYNSEYEELVKIGGVNSIPVEYYKISWKSFDRQGVTAKSIPLKSALVDSSSARMQNGSDFYVSRIIKEILEDGEKVAISQTHRQMRENFMQNKSVKYINSKIKSVANITNKEVSISVDLSSHTAWEGSLMTYIDSIPFHYIGKGEQCIIKTKLALSSKKISESTVLLIEEPENHLSHSKLNQLIRDISKDHGDKQIIITTHSSFVANKLGLENLILLKGSENIRISDLKSSEFFKKLPGYDTLRLVLSDKAILVEGPSDELVVQRAYMDKNSGQLPLENGIDVISVGTSFLNFVELAMKLHVCVAVVTDNDGDFEKVEKKYSVYKGNDYFKLCCDTDVDVGGLEIKGKAFNYNTLEPKILKENGIYLLNNVFETKHKNEDDLLKYMQREKTRCALAIFSTEQKLSFPKYLMEAIAI